MEKQKRIEEIEQFLARKILSGAWNTRDIAEGVYELIAENKVVLTKEELDKKYVSMDMYELAKAFHDEKCAEFEQLCYDYYKLKAELEQAYKTAAEKFAKMLKESLDISVEGYSTSEVMSEIEDTIDDVCIKIAKGDKQ